MQNRYKNMWMFFLILLIFFIPMWAAHWLYYNSSHFIRHTSQHGLLLQPAIDLRALPLKTIQGNAITKSPFLEHWTLLTVTADKTMTPATVKKLFAMRQIRLMLGKNMDHVQRMLIFYPVKSAVTISAQLVKPYEGTLFFTLIKDNRFTQAAKKAFLLVDPNGQLIMMYDENTNPKYIMQDLKKLVGSA